MRKTLAVLVLFTAAFIGLAPTAHRPIRSVDIVTNDLPLAIGTLSDDQPLTNTAVEISLSEKATTADLTGATNTAAFTDQPNVFTASITVSNDVTVTGQINVTGPGSTNSIITMTSPNGTNWLIQVNNTGTLTVTQAP